MIPLLVSAVVGALVLHRTRPTTRVERSRTLGARSGAIYNTESIVGTPIVIIRHGHTSVAVQKYADRPGYYLLSANDGADPSLVNQIAEDFCFRELPSHDK